MGNVVVGEALRLAGANLIVNTYVASQAAVSARSYDNTVPADISIFLVTPDSEGHYYTNGAPPYFSGISGAGNFVDFYNPQDWALGKWVSDQANKPGFLITSGQCHPRESPLDTTMGLPFLPSAACDSPMTPTKSFRVVCNRIRWPLAQRHILLHHSVLPWCPLI